MVANPRLGQGWMDLVLSDENKAMRIWRCHQSGNKKRKLSSNGTLPSHGRTEFLLANPPESDSESDSHDSPEGSSEPEREPPAEASTFGMLDPKRCEATEMLQTPKTIVWWPDIEGPGSPRRGNFCTDADSWNRRQVLFLTSPTVNDSSCEQGQFVNLSDTIRQMDSMSLD